MSLEFNHLNTEHISFDAKISFCIKSCQLASESIKSFCQNKKFLILKLFSFLTRNCVQNKLQSFFFLRFFASLNIHKSSKRKSILSLVCKSKIDEILFLHSIVVSNFKTVVIYVLST